jgi:hypothetical protein
MKYITTAATPKYVLSTSGFYSHSGTVPTGSEITIASTGLDSKSDRPVGYLASGEIVYIDTLTRVLDEVVAKSTRLWDWLAAVALVGGAIGYGVYEHKKSKSKAK